MAFEFYGSFCKCAKRRKNKKKMKKLSHSLKSHISRECLCLNLVCGVLALATAKIILFHKGSTELQRCENRVFFLPINILTGVVCWLLGRATKATKRIQENLEGQGQIKNVGPYNYSYISFGTWGPANCPSCPPLSAAQHTTHSSVS